MGSQAILREVRFDGPTRFGCLACAAYVAVSWSFRFDTEQGRHNASLTYPFDTFSMYAEVLPDEASAVMVRHADGHLSAVGALASLDCARASAALGTEASEEASPLLRADGTLDEGACAPTLGTSIRYLDEDLAAFLRTHRGPGPLRVELIRRTWAIAPGRATASPRDCVLATCAAAP